MVIYMNQILDMLEKVATILTQINIKIVFTGGATIALYLDDVSAPDVRPTDDVDCVVEITSRVKYYQLSDRLRELGLSESTEPGVPLCRWQYEGINIDIMPCDESVLGFTNRWYSQGIRYSLPYQLPSSRQILIFSIPYLLASKIEAFIGRGQGNFYYSADIEDIITLLDGCKYLEEEIQQADLTVQQFLAEWFRTERENLLEIAPAFLSSVARRAGRGILLNQRIERLTQIK